MENRECGYYWVNIHSSYGWQLGYWQQSTETFSFLVTSKEWTNDLVIEVDEKRIIRE